MKFEDVLRKVDPDRYELFKTGKLSKHISVKQFADPNGFVLPEYPDTIDPGLAEHLVSCILFHIDFVDFIFESYKGKLVITDFYRTYERFQKLKKTKPKDSASTLSPHVFGVATDLKDLNLKDQMPLYTYIISNPYGRNLRIGIKKYNSQFIHIDTAFNLDLDRIYANKYLIDSENTYRVLKKNWVMGVRW